jgi:Putative transposase
MTLDAVEFIRRFLLHMLPSGFVRIRHFAFLANRKRAEKLALCRSLLPTRPTAPEPTVQTGEPEPRLCPICKLGWLVSIEILPALALACTLAPTTADTS